MTPFKKRIASAFSKGSSLYAKEALLQQEVAKHLATLFKPVEGELLELGCGTGFLTEEILKKYPGSLLGLDLSSAMVEICKQKFPKAHFVQGDAERLNEVERFSAIFSGMTLQWFEDPKKSVAAIRRALKKGGTFYFSYMNERSYPEWSYFPLNLKMNSSILLEEFENIFCKEFEWKEHYENPLAFLQEMKKIGAATSLQNGSRLKELIKLARCGKMVSITSRVTIGMCHV